MVTFDPLSRCVGGKKLVQNLFWNGGGRCGWGCMGDGWRGVWGEDVVCEIPQGKLCRHRGRGSGQEGRSSDTATTTTGDACLHGNLLHQFNLFVTVAYSFSLAGKNGGKVYKFPQKSGAKQAGSLRRPQRCAFPNDCLNALILNC